MTAPTTTELLYEWDRRRPRSQQTEIGMSDIGGCERRAGYRMAGTVPSNAGGSMQAILGSAVHEAVADILLQLNVPGDIAETEVRFGGILGHFDRYHAAEKLVVDVKTTSSRWLESIKVNGADYQHRWQVALYGAGLWKTHGVPVERVRIDYIARDTGEEYNWPNLAGAPFDPRDVRDAMQWLNNVRSVPVGMLPRKYLPDSKFCGTCPFAGDCWEGAVVGRSPLSVIYLEDPDAEQRAEDLFQIRKQIKALKEQEVVLKGSLDAIRPDDGGRVQVGERTINFTPTSGGGWKLAFVAGSSDLPAVGYDEENVA